MGGGASSGHLQSEYERYSVESSKRELKQAFLQQRALGMDGDILFDHMAQLTERTLARQTPGSSCTARRKFNYPGHTLTNNIGFLVQRVPMRESASNICGGEQTLHWVENGDSRLSASLVQVDSMSLRNRHRPLRRAAMNDMMKLQENKLSIG